MQRVILFGTVGALALACAGPSAELEGDDEPSGAEQPAPSAPPDSPAPPRDDDDTADAAPPPPDAAQAAACTEPPCPLTGARALSVSTGHGCVVTATASVACWGWNDFGQLGTGDKAPQDGAVTLDLQQVVQVVTGNGHTCSLHGDGKVRCWGDNDDGQLGTGDFSPRLTPGEAIASLSDITELTAGADHTCALHADGTVSCWGRNYNGQLGIGFSYGDAVFEPTRLVGLADVKALTANGAHTCALHADGSASCWGYGGQGQLGAGSEMEDDEADLPVQVVGLSGATRIQAGFSTTCAIDAEARMRCWGTFTNGHSATAPTAWTPALVAGVGPSVIDIAPSGYHACVLYQGGQAQCWGMNLRGQLGTMECDGAFADPGVRCEDAEVPTDVLRGGFTEVRSFTFHTCALDEAGTVYCWGGNWLGQLGDGTMLDRGKPAPVLSWQ